MHPQAHEHARHVHTRRLKAVASYGDSSRMLRLQPFSTRSSGLKSRRRPSHGDPLTGVPYRGCLHLDPKHGITGMRLSGHVRFDDLVGDVAATAAQGSSRPHIATPKALPPLGKFGQQTLGALALHPLDQATAGDVQREIITWP